jgi:hypothetical protein
MHAVRITRIMLSVALLLSAFALIPTQSTQAKGDAAKVILKGPGLKGEVEITDRSMLEHLSIGLLESFDAPVSKLPSLGAGYELTRYIQEPKGDPFALDHIHYFPVLSEKQDYVFYDGMVGNYFSDQAGKWFLTTKDGTAAMRKLLAKLISTSTVDETLMKTDLGDAPQSCKAASKLEKADAGADAVVKVNSNLWVEGFAGPDAALTVTADKSNQTKHGWATDIKLLVNVGSDPVTIWGRDLNDDSPLWFSIDGQDPTTAALLSPYTLLKSADQKTKMAAVRSTLFVPKAGCYQLLVQVKGRSAVTDIRFAAGQ